MDELADAAVDFVDEAVQALRRGGGYLMNFGSDELTCTATTSLEYDPNIPKPPKVTRCNKPATMVKLTNGVEIPLCTECAKRANLS
jgi:hypothetical protein